MATLSRSMSANAIERAYGVAQPSPLSATKRETNSDAKDKRYRRLVGTLKTQSNKLQNNRERTTNDDKEPTLNWRMSRTKRVEPKLRHASLTNT